MKDHDFLLSNRELEDLVIDWLRREWPAIISTKHIHDMKASQQVVSHPGGTRFPVCSCIRPLGKHGMGRVLTNVGSLKDSFPD